MPARFTRNQSCGGYVLQATCEICGAPACYGLRGFAGGLSRWFCPEHADEFWANGPAIEKEVKKEKAA